MYEDSVSNAVSVAVRKRNFLRANPAGYFISSMLAGLYIGLGIVLIYAIGSPLKSAGHPALKLVMGASFGIALTLVVFAGSELFTGNTMYMTLGWLRRAVSFGDLLRVWLVSWLGNLAGSLALAAAVVYAGSLAHADLLVHAIASAKMGAPASVLFVSGLLCNILVCLALWTSGRTGSDAAKILLICLCLFAFIGSGFEHSVANMSLLGVGVLAKVGVDVSWSGLFYNLLWVSLGNIVGGAVVLAGSYHLIAERSDPIPDKGNSK